MRRYRFKAVELLSPYALPAAELKTLLSASGLQLVLLNTPPGGTDAASIEAAWASKTCWGTACLPGREAEFEASIAPALRYAAALGTPRADGAVSLSRLAVRAASRFQ